MLGKRGWLVGGVLVCLILLAVAERASAIPAWARKYKTSCATCHEAYPRLNAVGEAFRLNGYRFPDDEMYIKDEPTEMGDEAYKKVWPKALWPSDIPGLPPISIRILSDYNIDIGGEADSRSTFDFPHELEIFGGGTLGDNMSFFVELEEEGGDVESVATLGFDDLLGPENVCNVRVGNMLGGLAGPFTARDHNRMTKDHYLYGNWRLPYPDEGTAAEFGTENDYRLRSGQPGVEVNGFGSRWYYALGVVEGDGGISEKDCYAQFACKIGGLGFDGSGADVKEGALPASGAESWRDDHIMLSLFAYRGTAGVVGPVVLGSPEGKDRFWRVGPGVQWKHGDLRIGAAYILGENNRPYVGLSNDSVDSDTWFVEAEYFLYPWLIPSVRYEELMFDLPSAVPFLQEDQDQARIIASVKAILRANVTLILEGRFATHDQRFTHAAGETDDDNRVSFRLDFAF